jgi:hypothetical protein
MVYTLAGLLVKIQCFVSGLLDCPDVRQPFFAVSGLIDGLICMEKGDPKDTGEHQKDDNAADQPFFQMLHASVPSMFMISRVYPSLPSFSTVIQIIP